MTKEEIIHRLQYARHRIDNITYAPDVLKAIDIAIETVSNTNPDTISRQAAISAICNACGKIDCDKMDKCEKLQLPPANCSEFPNSSDTISRQQAIEALKNDMASLDHIIKGMSANDVRLDAYVSQRNQVNYDIYTINNLPPAQPEQLGTNLAEVGTDTISRKAAIDVVKGIDRSFVKYIEELPPAQPERIIHCKDCEWWTKQECSPQGRCALSGMYPTGGWFCGNARRREVTT